MKEPKAVVLSLSLTQFVLVLLLLLVWWAEQTEASLLEKEMSLHEICSTNQEGNAKTFEEGTEAKVC